MEKPSKEISAEKAKKMLKEGTAHGKPLTKKQKGMLGAAAGKGNPGHSRVKPGEKR